VHQELGLKTAVVVGCQEVGQEPGSRLAAVPLLNEAPADRHNAAEGLGEQQLDDRVR
jgi:hypothetical protein